MEMYVNGRTYEGNLLMGMMKPLKIKKGTKSMAPTIRAAMVLLMKKIEMTSAKLWASNEVAMTTARYAKKRQTSGGGSTRQ